MERACTGRQDAFQTAEAGVVPHSFVGDRDESGASRFGRYGRNNVKRGRQTERFCRLRGRSKPLKGKAHGRHRRETKPEGPREERNARRLRKPEGVAQPGEANPVLVASRCLMRRRATRPHEGMLLDSGPPRVIL
jgi:hypothetical protein